MSLISGQQPENGNQEIQKANQIRRAIRNYFTTRDCFVFAPPTRFKWMDKLETMKKEELDEDFLEQGELFKEHILNRKKTYKMCGQDFNGESYSMLCR